MTNLPEQPPSFTSQDGLKIFYKPLTMLLMCSVFTVVLFWNFMLCNFYFLCKS